MYKLRHGSEKQKRNRTEKIASLNQQSSQKAMIILVNPTEWSR